MFLCGFFFLVVCSAQKYPIEHVVVIMMENRSFDHMLGYLHLNYSDIDGLTGKEFNHYKADDPNSPIQMVNSNGFDEGPDDPGHGWEDTAEEIYGYVVDPKVKGVPKMNGFAQNALSMGHSVANPFSMFTSESAPILNTLAVDFAVFDKWFCSLPGPTDPNRAYFMSGTSDGVITNFNGTLWGQQSYFDWLRNHNISWRAYYQDDPWAIMYFKDMHSPENHKFVGTYDQFVADVKQGVLAQFTLLQPRETSHNGPPTWQHPDSSIKEGERLYKEIYELLRNSPFWEKLAFIITYDEHGGFYDHVAPPQTGVPNPDGVIASNKFNFDRLGIRIPTVLISPWIPKGTVEHEPTGPTSTSQYDSTSIMSTVNKLFGVTDHINARDAWSGTFEHLFSLSQPRTDCPTTLPDVPATTPEELEKIRNLPLNDHLEIQVAFYCKFNHGREDCGKDITTQIEASLFIEKEVQIFLENLKKKSL